MKKAILYGTFDLLHFGHIEAIKYCKSICDYLIVAVSTDEFNKEKKKTSKIPYWQRRELVEALADVDKVIPEFSWEQKITDVDKYKLDIVFISEDFFDETEAVLGDSVEIKCIPRTPEISSTQLKKK